MEAPGQEILPDEKPAMAAVAPPNTQDFPGPVWDAAKEIEAKGGFPTAQLDAEQIDATAAIIWAKVRPLFDAAAGYLDHPDDVKAKLVLNEIIIAWEPVA